MLEGVLIFASDFSGNGYEFLPRLNERLCVRAGVKQVRAGSKSRVAGDFSNCSKSRDVKLLWDLPSG